MRFAKKVGRLPPVVGGLLLAIAALLIFTTRVSAATTNSFVTIVNPVRGGEFWTLKDEMPAGNLGSQYDVIRQNNLPATWLLRFDALYDGPIVNKTRMFDSKQELGLFLEVIPSLANSAGVKYNKSFAWHFAQSVFLTGYDQSDRTKLIDAAFNRFHDIYGYYPTSVGLWWIDAYSLSYMQQKYGVTAAMIVADQYSTDNYQIWGQYWSSPYYPSITNMLFPALTTEKRLPVVVTQWAARDPYNGYGNGVYESTYSVQANDYQKYHNLGTDYFGKLVDIYTKPIGNQYGQMTVGLENDYSFKTYGPEYARQIQLLVQKQQQNQFAIVTQRNFSNWYRITYPDTSPPRVISADDPLGTGGKAIWYMDTHYRAGWFYIPLKGSFIRDLRPYIEGTKEACYDKICKSINFATTAGQVIDEVTFGENYKIDGGDIANFKQQWTNEGYVISYDTAEGKHREIKFLTQDISIDGNGHTIPGLILDNHDAVSNKPKIQPQESPSQFKLTPLIGGALVFLIFTLFLYAVSVLLLDLFDPTLSPTYKQAIAIPFGIALITLIGFVSGFLHLPQLLYILCGAITVGGFCVWLQRQKSAVEKPLTALRMLVVPQVGRSRDMMIVIGVIIIGTIAQCLTVFRSGIPDKFGIPFWGPNGHDAIWHIALIEQLKLAIPPENPVFAGEPLKNYHYFYDLFLATVSKTTGISSFDLYFRFIPLLLSVLFGVVVYLLTKRLTGSNLSAIFALILCYFAGSFGFIVEIIKKQTFFASGGESLFWANQAISFHLNPPFAVSIVLLIAGILLFIKYMTHPQKWLVLPLIVLFGTLIEFKVYAGITALAGILAAGVYRAVIKRRFDMLVAAVGSSILAFLVFWPNNGQSGSLVIFAPLKLITDMVRADDRLGWQSLYTASQAYLERGQWFKYTITQVIAIVVFFVGNFGVRIFGLIAFKFYVLRKIIHKNLNELDVFFAVFLLASLLPPVFFVQEGTEWNSIQFLYYAMFISALFTGIVFTVLINRYRPKIIFVTTVAILLFIAVPTTVSTLRDYLPSRAPAKMSYGELAAINFLKTKPYGTILTAPFNKKLTNDFAAPIPLFAYTSTGYVAAFTGKPVFVEDEINNLIIGNDVASRVAAQTEFFQTKDLDFANSFLRKNNIRYIYLARYLVDHLDEEPYRIKKLFENDEAQVYEVLYK